MARLEWADTKDLRKVPFSQKAYLKQLAYFATHCEIAIKNSELAPAAGYPTVYTSALIEDCIENGRTREEGAGSVQAGVVGNPARSPEKS